MNLKLLPIVGAVGIPIQVILSLFIFLAPQPAQSATSSLVSWTDDFNNPTLNSRWEWIRESSDHWSLTVNPGYMRITTQSSGEPIGKNLLVQPAPAGNFEIETRVFVTPTENMSIARLLLHQDDDNYLLFSPGTPYMKISRQGDLYKLYESENGSDWIDDGTHMLSGFVPTNVGLAALNQGETAAEIDADFDYFRIDYDDVITIGVAAPLSGALEWFGWPVANSVQLAISQTNAAGGVNLSGITYTLAMVTADDICDPTQAITAANTLVNAGVVAVVGHVCSDSSSQGQPIYAAAGIPMISPSSTKSDLTQSGYINTFRTVSHDGIPPERLAIYFRKWLGLSRVAIVDGPDDLDSGAGDVFSNTFAALGGTVTSRRHVSGASQFDIKLSAIKAENPEGIYYIDSDASRAGLFSLAAYNLSMTDVIMGWTTMDNFDETNLNTYVTASDPAAAENDYVYLQYRRLSDMPGWTTYSTDYIAAGFPNYGTDVYSWPFGVFAYDAANIIIEAMRRAGNISPSAIRDEIAATQDFEGAVGTYEGFDEYGDVIPQWSWIERFMDGEWHILSPSQMFMPAIIR